MIIETVETVKEIFGGLLCACECKWMHSNPGRVTGNEPSQLWINCFFIVFFFRLGLGYYEWKEYGIRWGSTGYAESIVYSMKMSSPFTGT